MAQWYRSDGARRRPLTDGSIAEARGKEQQRRQQREDNKAMTVWRRRSRNGGDGQHGYAPTRLITNVLVHTPSRFIVVAPSPPSSTSPFPRYFRLRVPKHVHPPQPADEPSRLQATATLNVDTRAASLQADAMVRPHSRSLLTRLPRTKVFCNGRPKVSLTIGVERAPGLAHGALQVVLDRTKRACAEVGGVPYHPFQ